MKSAATFVFLLQLYHLTGTAKDGRPVKKSRANCRLDRELGGQPERSHYKSQSDIPPGFLSPSVKEYLELGKSIPGRPGTDYPILSEVPYTSFYCEDQEWPGFFADMDTRCQTWHYCDIDGRQATFLCPNGTQFSQALFVCDWWFNVNCDLSLQFYFINSRLYHRPVIDSIKPHRKITKDLLDMFAARGTASVDGEQDANSTISRKQRETYERERRLIPYMTYYIAPSLTTRTSPEARGILIPIATPRENIFQIHAFPKISLPANQNDNSRQIHILPKPVLRLQSPSFLPSTIQAGKQENGVPPQIYGIGNQYTDSGVTSPSIGPQGQTQRIQSESRPLQIIKIHPETTEQKFTAPQFIKVIPIISKLSSTERSSKSFVVPPRQYSFSTPKVPSTLPQSSSFDDQNYHKEHASSHNQNSFQGNIIYANHNTPKNGRLAFIDSNLASDKNEYTLAKITLSSTTPSPYDDIQFKLSGGGAPVALPNADILARERLTPVSPAPEGHNRGQLSTVSSFSGQKYVTIPSGRPQVYYVQKANGDINQEAQDLLQTQNSQLPKLRVPLEEKIRFVATVTPVPVTNDLESTQWKIRQEVPREQNYEKQALNTISSLLKETNKLPKNLTPHNIDAGIKTLALILERLQQQQQQQNQENADKSLSQAQNLSTSQYSAANNEDYKNPKKVHSFPEKSGTSTPGRPGIDYPIYSTIPQTNFDCSTQRYKGFFGDPDTNCQVWHYCDLNGGQASFLCPNGTIFSQVALTCDWWFNVKCASTSQLYVLNERLYKYILPFSPSFPEDFSGPVVDTYLEAKFKEMEAKSRKKGNKSSTNSTTTVKPDIATEMPTEGSIEITDEYQTPGREM